MDALLKKPRLLLLWHGPFWPISQGIEARTYYLLKTLSRDYSICASGVGDHPERDIPPANLLGDVTFALQPFPSHKSFAHRAIGRARYRLHSWLYGHTLEETYALHPGRLRELERLVKSEPWGAVITMYYFYGPWLRATFPDLLTICDANDLQYQRHRILSGHNPRRWPPRELAHLREREMDAYRCFDLLLAVSGADARELRQEFPQKPVLEIPTGLDTDALQPSGAPKYADPTLLFFGVMSGTTNIQAALRVHQRILPKIVATMPQIRYLIVGSSPPPEVKALAEDGRTVVTGRVEELAPWFGPRTVLICPFEEAYGNRGRLYEALALGCPCVVTPQAIEGMGLDEESGVFVGSTDDELAQLASGLLSDPERRAVAGQQAREWVVRHRSLEATYGRIVKAIEELRSGRRVT